VNLQETGRLCWLQCGNWQR